MSSSDRRAERPDLTILMPVFNERLTVEAAIGSVFTAALPVETFELIVIDDGSTDGSSAILDSGDWPEPVKIVHHATNQGKGAAIQTGLLHARGRVTTIMDADLELSPDDLGRLLPPILAGQAEVVFGARAFPHHTARQVRYWIGNRGVSLIGSLLFRRRVTDIMTCYKAMGTELFRSLPLSESGFAIEAEITARLLQTGRRIVEVPVAYEPRSRKAGKKLTMLDGFKVLRTLVRCQLGSRRPKSL